MSLNQSEPRSGSRDRFPRACSAQWPGSAEFTTAVGVATADGVLILVAPSGEPTLSDLRAVVPLFLRAAQRSHTAWAARITSDLSDDLASEAERMRPLG